MDRNIESRRALAESVTAEIESFRSDNLKVGQEADDRVVCLLERARQEFSDYQNRAQKDFDALNQRAGRSFTDVQEHTSRGVEAVRRERDQDLGRALDRLVTHLRQVASSDDGNATSLLTLLKTCVADVDERCRTTQTAWIHTQTQLLGSNVWALAWPEAARVARNRMPVGEDVGPIHPPGYQPEGSDDRGRLAL
ncbi:hypothetical protein A4X13_0g5136 [Tilletia indica]|uniref:Uncharacterized protein n=1 Tax=Tilletia indica TaxID=43049 RepID=A0A8T8SW52_9BASI|nr:hypothetical protein A4X13_0g5136 [Tilletia indica]